MKRKLLVLQQLIALLMFFAGICIIILLTARAMEKEINLCTYLGWLGITATTLYIDAWWINRHFRGGEWS